MPPNGLLRVLFSMGLPLGAGLGGARPTLGERVMREGLRFWSVAAVRYCCHGWKRARTSQKGQMEVEGRNMAPCREGRVLGDMKV